MAFTLGNQTPTTLSPLNLTPFTGDYNLPDIVKEYLVDPIFVPRNKNAPVALADDKGRSYDENDVLDAILSNLSDTSMNVPLEDALTGIYAISTINSYPAGTLPFDETFANQSGAIAKLPAPSARMKYGTAGDIIPAARAVLANKHNAGHEFFASIAYVHHPNTLAFWFTSEIEYDDFKTWLAGEITPIMSTLDADVQNLFLQFYQTKLGTLIEGIGLRDNDGDKNEENSFARVLVHMLHKYTQEQETLVANAGNNTLAPIGVMPFTLSELYQPLMVWFVNVEKHSMASAAEIDKEWRLVNVIGQTKIKMVSNKSLASAMAMPRAAAKAAAASAAHAAAQRAGSSQKMRSGKVRFRRNAPSPINLASGILKALNRMAKVNKSMNPYKVTRTTFSKANRRHPDDPNRPGKTTMTQYKPDIHVYVDCSGSISEANYQSAIKMLIKMAKKMDVDIYFTSFSHIISEPTRLRVAGKSDEAIWQEFRKIRKVSGGTDFSLVWEIIERSPIRQRQFSLMITDFEWAPQRKRVYHPRNLYYAPCATFDWNQMIRSVKYFKRSMRHVEPAIATRFIGVTV